jgi:pimeloyl-ACP methyl ester carboxylesterase
VTITALRTPDERFAALPGFPFAPRYLQDLPGYEGLRLHYLDEGPAAAPHTFLCLHGEPTWAYLYRKMIPVLVEAGCRVVAPDFFGFGRSDKPVDDAVYTFAFHRGALVRFIERLGLTHLTLVGQDWGGILGLTLVVDQLPRISRLLLMNTMLPTGTIPPSDGFLAWKEYVAQHPDLAVGKLMQRAVPGLTAAEAAAYDAPFPDARYKAGVRRFPQIVPLTPEMEGADLCRRAASVLRSEWRGQSFVAAGVLDPVLGLPAMQLLRSWIPGCPEPLVLEDAGHFVQERGDVVARAALAYFSG